MTAKRKGGQTNKTQAESVSAETRSCFVRGAAAAAAALSARKLTGISGEIHEAVAESRTGQRSRIVEMTNEREIDSVEHEREQQSESVWGGELEQLYRLQLWHVSQQRVEKSAAGEAARSDAEVIAGGGAEGCLARIEHAHGVCRCALVAIGRVVPRRVPIAQSGLKAACCRVQCSHLIERTAATVGRCGQSGAVSRRSDRRVRVHMATLIVPVWRCGYARPLHRATGATASW